MTVIYPLTLPSNIIRSIHFRPRAVVGLSRSPFTLQAQVQVHAGQIWAADVVMRPMQRTDADKVIGILLSLSGMKGTFLLGDVSSKTPKGTALGTPLINGAGQAGETLTTDGWTVSSNGVLLRGDWIQLGAFGSPAKPKRIYRVLNDVNSDSGGNAIIDIWPRIRESPANNEPLVLTNTSGTFMLEDNEMGWDISESLLYGVEFGAIEDLRT